MRKTRSDTSAKLIFVRDAEDLARVATDYGRANHFLTSDLSVYRQLATHSQAVSGTWEYLDDEVRPGLLLAATNLKDQWYEELRGCLIYRGINMGDAISFPSITFFSKH